MRAIVRHGVEHADLLDVAHGNPALRLHWRRRFRAQRIGPLGRWHRVLRMVTIGVIIQGNPDASLPEIAMQTGFAESTSLSRACAEALGARPKQIRAWIGWQCLLAPAPARAGLSPGTRHPSDGFEC